MSYLPKTHLPDVELSPVESTTKAVKLALESEYSAAIASAMASDMYGIEVLANGIQDMQGNTTRFLVIGHNYSSVTGEDKTSVVFGIKDAVGELHEALAVFKNDDINLSKIESRPSKNKAWEYFFFVDIDGHAEDPTVAKALEELKSHCTLMTILGSYPRASI